MRTLAVINPKGGVGKTTTAVTVAHGLAMRGWSTLLVDLDPQGAAADCLGLSPGGELARAVLGGSPAALEDVSIETGRPNLRLVRSDSSTLDLKIALGAMRNRAYALDEWLRRVACDVVVLDCAPSFDVLQEAAVVAASDLILPTRLDQLSVKGVRGALRTLAALSEITDCRLGAVVPTFYDRQTNESYVQLRHLVEVFHDAIWPPIPQDFACRECTRYGQTLWEYAPSSRALEGYPERYPQGRGRRPVGGYRQILDRIEEKILS